MLLKAETEIGPEETAIELGQRLATMGAELLVRTLDGLAAGTIAPEPQDNAKATHAPIIKKEDGLIDWARTASEIHSQIRGLQPWPGAYTTFRGQKLHVWKSRVSEAGGGGPGSVAGVKPLRVACGEGSLELIEVQMEGRKRISAADFANGQRLSENESLGAPQV
jgi:methionyl-tRNA formyltransferase